MSRDPQGEIPPRDSPLPIRVFRVIASQFALLSRSLLMRIAIELAFTHRMLLGLRTPLFVAGNGCFQSFTPPASGGILQP